MSDENKDNFSYLSGDGRWPDFQWAGLELREDGALQLYSLPLLESELPEELSNLDAPDGPSGLAVDADGTIYFSDPSSHTIFRIDVCDGAISGLPCIGTKGPDPGQLNTPRGLLIPKYRHTLFVADSANDRIQGFDLDSLQLVDIRGQAHRSYGSQAYDALGQLDTPWALAGDDKGNTYVVDYGHRRVQKFDRAGDPVPSFHHAMRRAGLVHRPSDIAVYTKEGTTRLYIIDEAARTVFVFNEDGEGVFDAEGFPLQFKSPQMQRPMGIAVTETAVYVGDNARRRILKFEREGERALVGEAVGYQGPVAALALDHQGHLLVHAGTSLAPVRLLQGSGYRMRGTLWSKALQLRNFKVDWHQLYAETGKLAANAHLRLFVHTSDDVTDAPTVAPDSENPFADPRWRPQFDSPERFDDVEYLFIGGAPASYLWVGALFSGDGRATPVVSTMRVEFGDTPYLEQLPAIYRGDSPCGDFLRRFLSLFDTFFGEVEDRITHLSALFDPFAAPKEYLPWLAGWLGLELDEDWPEEKQRQMIAGAFEMYGRRGTVEGLREALRIYAGVNAIIEEPILKAAWWSLPTTPTSCECQEQDSAGTEKQWGETENSILGVTTMLAPAEPQGAVLGTTATLDRSQLITDELFGTPLFDDVANRFIVQVYRGQLQCAETLDRVRAVIEREKPAHTQYHLCTIEPRMRVGFQARVGIDTVVAGPLGAMTLGQEMMLGRETALGGRGPGRIGEESRVGLFTRVG